MARQRFIWPTIWKDPVFGRLTPIEQVLFIGLFSMADDEGRLNADPAVLRAEIFPYARYSNSKVKRVRDEIVEKCDQVVLYRAVDNPTVDYIALLKWAKYQRPKYPKPSQIPPPLEESFPERSANPGGTLENGSATGFGLGREGTKPEGSNVNESSTTYDESRNEGETSYKTPPRETLNIPDHVLALTQPGVLPAKEVK